MMNAKLIAKANRLADELARVRRKLRPPKPQRVKSDRPRGRPAVPADTFAIAKDLVGRGLPIADVAMKLNLGTRTLYDHGISRANVEKEKEEMAAAAVKMAGAAGSGSR